MNLFPYHSTDSWIYSFVIFLTIFLVFKLIKFNRTSSRKFSISFWVLDNYKELFLGAFIYYTAFRFPLLITTSINKYLVTGIVSFIYVVLVDKLGRSRKNKNSIKNK